MNEKYSLKKNYNNEWKHCALERETEREREKASKHTLMLIELACSLMHIYS